MTCRQNINSLTQTANRETERIIKMWRMERKTNRVYYVPLDDNFKPIADVALQDVEVGDGASPASANFVLVSGRVEDSATPTPAAEKPKWFIGLIETILRGKDATTYEIYEELVLRLGSANMLQAMPQAGVDVQGILEDNFGYYVAPVGVGGVLVRLWTLDEEMTRSRSHSDHNVERELAPLLQFRLSNN
ncbi:MAG: hypothetical protein HY665_04930 [Chloroflexi bacterium]|nr:hypothetical protein [Chloroflexota bacterium]